MLVDLAAGFVFLAGLRSGSTSIERVLGPDCHIRLIETRFGKHMTLAEVERHLPWIFQCRAADTFHAFGVVRDPADYLASLYRFHQKPDFDGMPHSTRGMPFATFLAEWVPRSWHAQPQIDRFVAPRARIPRVQIWNFPHLDVMARDLLQRFRPGLALPRLNYSPADIPVPELGPEERAAVHARFPRDAALTAPGVLYTWIDARTGETLETAAA
jgi:hypothetical protein